MLGNGDAAAAATVGFRFVVDAIVVFWFAFAFAFGFEIGYVFVFVFAFVFIFVYGLRFESGMVGTDSGTDVELIEKAPDRRSFPDLEVVGAAGEVGAVVVVQFKLSVLDRRTHVLVAITRSKGSI